MQVVLWDTRTAGIAKDLAAGFGAAPHARWGGLPGRIFRWTFQRERRPVPLLMARLAAAFHRRGHEVRYVVDRTDVRADLHVFCPALATLAAERRAIGRILRADPRAGALAVGPVATALPHLLAGDRITVVKGEAEQLWWKLDEVLHRPGALVQLGVLEDLDRLPPPDWSPFSPRGFRMGREFRRFPTALVEQGRGCRQGCGSCPHATADAGMRFRGPESIVEEIRRDVRLWDFRSFAFSGPMFGADPQRAFHLADLLGRLPFRIEFSLATRPGLVPPEMLRALHRLGLACVALDLQTPGEARPGPDDMPLHDDAAAALIEACRGMGIRTVAKFVVGHPTDPIEAVRGAFDRAGRLNPTFVEFHLLTRYPGADSLGQSGRFEVDDLSRHTRQRAVLRYECLGGDELERARDDGLRRFYFRRAYFRENLHLLWSGFPRFGADPARRKAAGTGADAAHAAPPRPTPGPGAYGRTRMLRSDGPHIQPGISEDHREPMPPEAL